MQNYHQLCCQFCSNSLILLLLLLLPVLYFFVYHPLHFPAIGQCSAPPCIIKIYECFFTPLAYLIQYLLQVLVFVCRFIQHRPAMKTIVYYFMIHYCMLRQVARVALPAIADLMFMQSFKYFLRPPAFMPELVAQVTIIDI